GSPRPAGRRIFQGKLCTEGAARQLSTRATRSATSPRRHRWWCWGSSARRPGSVEGAKSLKPRNRIRFGTVAVCAGLAWLAATASPATAGFNISGSVTSTSGGGIQGVTVTAIDSLGDAAASVVTNSSGAYTLSNLQPGA